MLICCYCCSFSYSCSSYQNYSLSSMPNASLTARLAGGAMQLTREAHSPSVCCWFPACSMPGSGWRCGWPSKIGARSEQQAAEQQQRELVWKLVRGLVQVRAGQQQNSVPESSQGAVHAPATEVQTPQLACIARCLKNYNHISHSCYFCSAHRYPSSVYFFKTYINTRFRTIGLPIF